MSDVALKEAQEKAKKGMQRLRERIKSKKEPIFNPLWPPGLKYGETPLYQKDRALQKQRTRERREKQTDQEKNIEKEERNERMRKLREKQTFEERKAENERKKDRMRKLREIHTSEEKIAENEKKKEKMRQLRERRKMEKESISSDSETSGSHSPDIVRKLNLHYRNQNDRCMDKKDVTAEVASVEEGCVCDVDVNCEYCAKLEENEKGIDYILTPEERERYEKEDLEQHQIMLKNRRKSKRQEIKDRMMKPLPALPERELSEYEKIREEIIAQRKKEWLIAEKEWEKNYGK